MRISTRSGLVLAVVLAALVAGVWWWRQSPDEVVTADLVDLFAEAEKRSTGPPEVMFVVGAQRVRGEAKRAIYMHPTSRLTYRQLQVPDHGRLRAWIAVKEDVWDKSTDGVFFRLGISDGAKYSELVARQVNPRNNVEDRRWVPIDVDLSTYAGRSVDVILNTNTSPPGRGDNPSWDFGIWGAPEIVSSRGGPTTATAAGVPR